MLDDGTRTLDHTGRAELQPNDVVDALILATTADGTRPPGVLRLSGAGVELGRSADLFPGGPLRDPVMSRRHAAIRKQGDRWLVEDLQSRNGVFVGGERIRQPTVLGHGDVIRLANTVLVMGRVPGVADAEDGIVGVSEAIAKARRQARMAAPHLHTILLLGPTGAGKEVFAHTIHRWSERAGPVIGLNCASLSRGIVESELYGHIAGAFTGADADRIGLFERAHDGTLLLDELGELPLDVQAGLLRTLETRTIRPVGAVDTRPVNARLVAATSADLVANVQGGTFRADLYARLAQWVIEVPALMHRREDIPFLARALMAREGMHDASIAAELMEALLMESWPLNVRGLRNVLLGARMSSTSSALRLTPEVKAMLERQRALEQVRASAAPSSTGPAALPSDEELMHTLRTHGGSVAAAARALGCTRQQLYRRVKSLEIDLAEIRRDS